MNELSLLDIGGTSKAMLVEPKKHQFEKTFAQEKTAFGAEVLIEPKTLGVYRHEISVV